MTKRALILIDLQNDFMPGGSLAVPQADTIIPLVNKLQRKFECIVATQDWHPAHHKSFAVNHPGHQEGDVVELSGLPQILWPAHCIEHTAGAELHQDLETQQLSKIVHKGTDPTVDSYSAFHDNAHLRATDLFGFLKEQGITEVYLLGVATDYCVKYSALDACELGFKTYVIQDACRGVNLNADDSAKAFAEMQEAGAILIHSKDVQ